MEPEKLEKVLSFIKGIEKKNLEFEKFLSSIKLLNRNEMLKEITSDIIKNNEIFKVLQSEDEDIIIAKSESKIKKSPNIAENLILKIKTDPSKKVLILRDFLNKLKDITEVDKKVLLQTLKDKNNEQLNKELENLEKVFGFKIQ